MVVPPARAAGAAPAAVVPGGEVPRGRPRPWQLLKALKRRDAAPVRRAVKADDAVTGIEAARSAGCWAVALSAGGDALGAAADEWAAMPAGERAAELAPVAAHFKRAGARFVIPAVAELPAISGEIAARLANGDRPARAVSRGTRPAGGGGSPRPRRRPPAGRTSPAPAPPRGRRRSRTR